MPARCETCHYWIPGEKYVEGGDAAQQSGLCKFDPQHVRNASNHWCGRWRMPTETSGPNTPAHVQAAYARYLRDHGEAPSEAMLATRKILRGERDVG